MKTLKVNNKTISPYVSIDTIFVNKKKSLLDLLDKYDRNIKEIQDKLNIIEEEQPETCKLPEIVSPYDNLYLQFEENEEIVPIFIVSNDYSDKLIYYKITVNALSGILILCSIDNGNNWTNMKLEGFKYIDNTPQNVPVIFDNNGNGFNLNDHSILFKIEPNQVAKAFITTEMYSLENNELLVSNTFNVKVGLFEEDLQMIDFVEPIETIESLKESYLESVNKINELIRTFNDMFNSMYESNSVYLINIFYDEINNIYKKISMITFKFELYSKPTSFLPVDDNEIEIVYNDLDNFENLANNYIVQLMEQFEEDEQNTFDFIERCQDFFNSIDVSMSFEQINDRYVCILSGTNDFIVDNAVNVTALINILSEVRSHLEEAYMNVFETGIYKSNNEKLSEGNTILDNLINICNKYVELEIHPNETGDLC